MEFTIKVTLLSDSTFGQGSGISGRLDTEAWHEPITGLPQIPGKRFRGLLVQSCGEILSQFQKKQDFTRWYDAAHFLFGKEGSTLQDEGALIPSDLTIQDDLRNLVLQAVSPTSDKNRIQLSKTDFWNAYTTIRTQTAISAATEAQVDKSLRTRRLVKRGTRFHGSWTLEKTPDTYAKALLFASISGIRRGGIRRNRGSGKMRCTIDPASTSNAPFQDAFSTLFQ